MATTVLNDLDALLARVEAGSITAADNAALLRAVIAKHMAAAAMAAARPALPVQPPQAKAAADNHRKRWSPKDVETLRQLMQSERKTCVEEACAALGRTAASVRSKWSLIRD